MRARAAAALVAAATLAACAERAPAPRPLTVTDRDAFAAKLEAAVLARLSPIPEADDAIAEAAQCAATIADVRPVVVRQSRPLLLGLPGGRLIVSTGLLASTESDAELRSALAHEAAHVAQDDLMRRLVNAYGAARVASIAGGGDEDVLRGMAANLAGDGVLARRGLDAEQSAEDAVRRAGCGEGGIARILQRAMGSRRLKPGAVAHPSAGPAPAPQADADASVVVLERVRGRLGPSP